MKKILITLVIMTALSAHAGWHRGYGFGAFPLILGGVIGYEIAQPHQQTVIIQQEQPPVQQTTVINGVLYVEVMQYFQDCNCYRKVLVPKQ